MITSLNTLVGIASKIVDVAMVTDPSGKIVWVGADFEKTTGYSPKEVIGHSPNILKSGLHEKAFYENLWKTISEKEVWFGIIKNRKKDGTVYKALSKIIPILDAKGTVTEFVCIQRDISLYEAILGRIIEAEKKLEMAFDVAQVAMFILSPGGVFLKENKYASAMLGYSPGELIGKNVIDVTFPDDIDMTRKVMKEANSERTKDCFSVEKRYLKKNGDILYGKCVFSVSRDESGNAEFFVAQVKDVTKELNLELEVLERAKSATAANNIFKVVSEISEYTINQEIFNIDNVLKTAGEKLQMSLVFIQNCRENMDIYKAWTSNGNRIISSEIEEMEAIGNLAELGKWISKGSTYMGRPQNVDLALTHLLLLEPVKKSNQIFVIPVSIRQKPWGILSFVNGNGHLWSDAEKEALCSLGRLVAIMIEENWEKAKLLEHISLKFDEIENLMDRKNEIA